MNDFHPINHSTATFATNYAPTYRDTYHGHVTVYNTTDTGFVPTAYSTYYTTTAGRTKKNLHVVYGLPTIYTTFGTEFAPTSTSVTPAKPTIYHWITSVAYTTSTLTFESNYNPTTYTTAAQYTTSVYPYGYQPRTTTLESAMTPTIYTTSTNGTGYAPTVYTTSYTTVAGRATRHLHIVFALPTIYTTSTSKSGYAPAVYSTSPMVPTSYSTTRTGVNFVPTTTGTIDGLPTIYTTSTYGTGYVPTTTGTEYFTGQPTIYTTGTNYSTAATTTPGTPTTYNLNCTPVTLSLPTHHGWAPVGSSNYTIAYSTNDAAGIHFTSLDPTVCTVNAKTGVVKALQSAFCEIQVTVTHTYGFSGVATSRFQLNIARKTQALFTDTVTFANGSTVLTAADKAKLNADALMIKADQLVNVVVNGNASPVGSSAQNLVLSQKRAQVTVAYLETKIAALGVEGVNFSTKWFGDKATKTRSATVFGL